MRCCARTKEKWQRRSKQTNFVFCKDHRYGWWMRIFVFLFVSVPGTALVYSQFYSDFIPKISKSTASVIQPKFDSLDKRFKILVLPFNKECEDMDGKYNEVGKVICRRLED